MDVRVDEEKKLGVKLLISLNIANGQATVVLVHITSGSGGGLGFGVDGVGGRSTRHCEEFF